jgi:hypothetical protein
MTKPVPIEGQHPLIAIVDRWRRAGGSITELAKRTGYPADTIYQYLWRAKKRPKTYLVAAEFAAAIARATGTAPYYLRPDLWESGWVFGRL